MDSDGYLQDFRKPASRAWPDPAARRGYSSVSSKKLRLMFSWGNPGRDSHCASAASGCNIHRPPKLSSAYSVRTVRPWGSADCAAVNRTTYRDIYPPLSENQG